MQSKSGSQAEPDAEDSSVARSKGDAGAEAAPHPRSASALGATSEPPAQPQPEGAAHQAGSFTVVGDQGTYSYSDGVLTVKGSAPLTISNANPAAPTTDRIEVKGSATANVTLAGVNIAAKSGAAIGVIDTAVLNCTLAKGSWNYATGSSNSAGVYVGSGAALTIGGEGGLNADGSGSASGVGSSYSKSGGNITIKGGTVSASGSSGYGGIAGKYVSISGGAVTATGADGLWSVGAGIDAWKSVTISGGSVTAIGNGPGASGISASNSVTISGGTVSAVGGGGYGQRLGGSGISAYDGVTISGGTVSAHSGSEGFFPSYEAIWGPFSTGSDPAGGAFIQADTIKDKTNQPSWSGVIFQGREGKVYGSPTLAQSATVPEGQPLVVPEGKTLTVADGATLVNDGIIENYGTLVNCRAIQGKGVIRDHTGDLVVQGGNPGEDYAYDSNGRVLTVKKGTSLAISGATTSDRIAVGSGVAANLTLSGVSVDVSATSAACALAVPSGATLNLTLAAGSENSLKSGEYRAGLEVPDDANVTISGFGALSAAGGDHAAGIGGGDGVSGGTIAVAEGTVTAQGGSAGAGIGSGRAGRSGGTISVSGGAVTATGGSWGAGIGGGDSDRASGCSGGTISVSGGTVTATGGSWGAGIGGGDGVSGGAVSVSGGIVTATGGSWGAGIGGGHDGSGGTFKTTSAGSAFVFASSISDASGSLPGATNPWSGVIFQGDAGKVYGSPALALSACVPAGKTLDVPSDAHLALGDGVTLTNDGTIENHGGISGDSAIAGGGTVTSDSKVELKVAPTSAHYGDALTLTAKVSQQAETPGGATAAPSGKVTFAALADGQSCQLGEPVQLQADPGGSSSTATLTLSYADPGYQQYVQQAGKTGFTAAYGGKAASSGSPGLARATSDPSEVDMGARDLTVTGGDLGTDYSYTPGVLKVLTGKPLTISGATTSDRIAVGSGVAADVTLAGVSVNVSATSDGCALAVPSGATLNLTLAAGSENSLKSGKYRAGLEVPVDATLDIRGSGALSATGGKCGAGIGGGMYDSGGKIVVTGGTVTAKGGDGAAGIGGGGSGGDCGTAIVSGGTVTAIGASGGAGIGGGSYGFGGTVAVSAGTVAAIGASGGAGIGGGVDGAGGTVAVSGGTVTAKGGDGGAGIGGISGYGGAFSTSGEHGAPGSAFVLASSISDASGSAPDARNPWSGVIFQGDEGRVYGSPALALSACVPAGKTLTVPAGGRLSLASGATLTNEGDVQNHGSIAGPGSLGGSGTLTNEAGVSLRASAASASSSRPAAYGDPVTLTAAVAQRPGAAPGAPADPSGGEVEFSVDDAGQARQLGTAALREDAGAWSASLTLGPSDPGYRYVQAGDGAFAAAYAGHAAASGRPGLYASSAKAVLSLAKAQQEAPSGLAPSPETVSGKGDGGIGGLTTDMEYAASQEAAQAGRYVKVTHANMAFAPGTYWVRMAGDGNHEPSPAAEVTVAAGRKLEVSLPDSQVGYTLTADKTELDWQGSAKLGLSLADGYVKTPAFAVKANGVALSPGPDGSYLLSSLEGDASVTVEGVAPELAQRTVYDPSRKASLTGMLSYGSSLGATPLAPDDEAYDALARAALADGRDVVEACDVVLSGAYEGGLKVSFEVGDSYDGRALTVYHRRESGEVEELSASVAGGWASVEADGLSPFLVAADRPAAPGPQAAPEPSAPGPQAAPVAPQTGDGLPEAPLALAVLASGGALAALGTRKARRRPRRQGR